MTLKACIVQHDPLEEAGAILDWLSKRQAEVTLIRAWTVSSFPDPRLFDLLILMGGPMSVNDEEKFPWLAKEKAFVREAVAGQVPMLGVCLGGQMIASALGAAVRPNPFKEIGWFEVEPTPAGMDDPLFLPPAPARVFQWHGDTFDLPAGAVLLATSGYCRHQAFRLGDNILALQFHLEVTPQLLEAFVATGTDELVPAPAVQSRDVLLAKDADAFRALHVWLEAILDRLIH